jgi:hypothetical protein
MEFLAALELLSTATDFRNSNGLKPDSYANIVHILAERLFNFV